MVRCYDCGQPVRDNQLLRKTVETGYSSGARSNRTYYHKVNLCPECWRTRRLWSCITAIMTLMVVSLVLGGVVVWLLWRGVIVLPATR